MKTIILKAAELSTGESIFLLSLSSVCFIAAALFFRSYLKDKRELKEFLKDRYTK
jgi:hypothetical protein